MNFDQRIRETQRTDSDNGRLRNGSPLFYKLLEKMAETHDRKSHDYASNDNPSGNYHFAGMLSKLFDNPDDAGFIGRIGEKLYRLANLENGGKIAKNESVEDTELDICVITTLWMADRLQRRTPIDQCAEAPKVDSRDEYILQLNGYIKELTASNFKLSERLNDYESRGVAQQEDKPISRLKQSRSRRKV